MSASKVELNCPVFSGLPIDALHLCSNAPINVSRHPPPPGAGWGIFLVWNGRLAPGVGIVKVKVNIFTPYGNVYSIDRQHNNLL